MRLRSLGIAAVAAGALMQSCQPGCTVPLPPAPGPPPIVSITISGQGNGHGRGLSAWGAYGSAVNLRWDWQRILDHYYGGTRQGTAANDPIGVRLLGLDNAPVTGVISVQGAATFMGVGGYRSLQAHYLGNGLYDVWGATGEAVCPGTLAPSGVRIGQFAGPVVFGTTVDETSAAPGAVLGLCQANGWVIHYRGTITALVDGSGQTRTVNTVRVENYLKGVLPREVSTSWGDAGSRAGMNSLYAMAVAARSFALSQNRYPPYAKTCDTSTCQVYGGAAYRADPSAPTSHPTVRVCESGNSTFECANTNQAVADTARVIRVWQDGRVVSTEYSASHGPYSAGGPFPSVDDSASNVPGNSLYTWTRTVDAVALETRYGLGNLVGARNERLPGTPYAGQWGNRVVLEGSAKTVVVSNLEFRNAFGFPSHGFTITGVTRG